MELQQLLVLFLAETIYESINSHIKKLQLALFLCQCLAAIEYPTLYDYSHSYYFKLLLF